MPSWRSASAGTDARHHQQLRRLQRTRGEQHLAPRAQHPPHAALLELDCRPRACPRTGCASPSAPVSICRGWAATHRIEVGARNRPALAVLLRHLIEADAFLRFAGEVVVARQAGLHAGFDEQSTRTDAAIAGRRRSADRRRRASRRRRARCSPPSGSTAARRSSPSRRAVGRPVVVVLALTAQVDHRVDGRRTAEPAPARLVADAATEARLRHRSKTPSCTRLR